MRKLSIAAIAVGAASLASIAVAQIVTPQVSTINSDDLVKIVPHGVARVGDQYAKPALLTLVSGYYKSAPATGFTYTFGAQIKRADFRPSTTLSTGAVTLPTGASDGQEACVYSKNIITTLTLSAPSGATLNDAVTTLGAAGHACYQYSLSNATWDRVE